MRTLAVPALAVLAALACASPAHPQAIQATVDRNQITVEEQLLLSIRVEGSQEAEPTLPELPDFQVLPGRQSTSMQIINGQVSSSIAYNFLLIPRRAGTFTIGPATVEIDGQTYSTRPFSVRVLEGSSEPSESRDYFISVRVSDTTPFVGQQVLFTWRFFRRIQIADARLGQLDFGDLLAEDLGDVREYQTTVNGVQYLVSEIRKALFAQREGKALIPPSELTIAIAMRDASRRSLFDDFFGRTQTQARVVRSQPIELDVRPLPPHPAGFSGLVGNFDVSAAISKPSLQVGESATLELTIRGTGNAQQISQPPLPDLSDFKVYDDRPTSTLDRSGTELAGSKSYRKALVPVLAGKLVVPPFDLVYFDPDAESYRTARTGAIALDVAPAAGKEELMLTESMAPTTGKVAVRILADDILPIERRLDAIEPQPLRGWRGLLWGALWLAPPLGYAGLLFWRRRQELYARDSGLRRRRTALRRCLDQLGRLELTSGDGKEAARFASRALRSYVGDKAGAEGSALTPLEVEGILCEAGVDEPTSRRTREILDRLEAAQFGVMRRDRAEDLGSSLRDLVKRLDVAFEGGGRLR